MKQKGFAPIIILLIVLVFGGIVGGMVYFRSKTNQLKSTEPQISPAISTSQSDQAVNWKTFTNEYYKFSLQYPSNWSYEDTINKDGNLKLGELVDKNHIGEIVKKYPATRILLNVLSYYPGTPIEKVKNLSPDVDPQWKDITVKTLKGKQVNHKGCLSGDCMSIILYRDNHNVLYDFGIEQASEKSNKEILDQILSTFRFTDTAIISSSVMNVTQAQAIEKVKNLSEVKDYLVRVPNGKVEFDHEDEAANAWVIHVYEVKNGHTATFNWYSVNKETGEITDNLGKEY